MTANELADELENAVVYMSCEYEAATMLRQQAKEIAELKKIVESTIGQAFYEDDYHKLQKEYIGLAGKYQEALIQLKKASEK